MKATIDISLCESCYCMTHTIEQKCGKCGSTKIDKKKEKESELKITFDRSTASWILKLLGKNIKKECFYCGKKITAKNVGAIFNGKMMCKNICCLVEYVDEKEKDAKTTTPTKQ